MMKPGAVFINTARGGLVNEADLFDALKDGTLSAAGLDVFKSEPYEPIPGKDLRTLRNVILTPHVGSNTDASNRRMAEACVNNARAFYEGRKEDITLVSE